MASVEDILLMQGRSRANAIRDQGQIRAEGWTNLADIVGGGLSQFAKQYQAKKESDAVRALLSRKDPPTPEEIFKVFGPERGAKVLDGLNAASELHHKQVVNQRDTAGRLAAGVQALPPDLQQEWWPQIRQAAIEGGLGDAQSIPEQLSPEYLKLVSQWAAGTLPEKPQDFTLGPGQSRFPPQGGAPIASVPATAPPAPAPRQYEVVVKGPNGQPIKKLVDEATMQQGVPQYEKPPEPKEAKAPETEWITRDNKPLQIPKGTAKPGDMPFQAPRSTSETAQDRQRIARVDSAKGFLDRLNELREKINTKMGPAAGLTGLARRGAASVGLDPDVAEYERIRAAGGRALAVAIMGAQNLSDADAKAWSDMLPGATIDRVTAKRLMDQISEMLSGMSTDRAPKATPAQSDVPKDGTEGSVKGVPAVWKTVNGVPGWYRK